MKLHSTTSLRSPCSLPPHLRPALRRRPGLPAGRRVGHDAAGRPRQGQDHSSASRPRTRASRCWSPTCPPRPMARSPMPSRPIPAAPAASSRRASRPPAGLAYYTVESAKDGATNVRRYSMILPGATFSGYVAVQVPGERHQDLHRRRRAPDVRLGRDPQGGSGRGAARADAVQDQRTQRASRMSARWRRAPPSFSPTATRRPASKPRPS